MAAMFISKRGITNINRGKTVSDGVRIITTSRNFASQKGNDGREKPKEDSKASNETVDHVADTAKDGLKRDTDAAAEKSGDANKPKKSLENDEENVAVGEKGTVKGENQSSG